MLPRPIINDALWRCLCPRYSQVVATSKRAVRNQSRTYVHQNPPTAQFFANGPNHSSHTPDNVAPSLRPRNETPLIQLPTAELYRQLRSDGAAGRHENVFDIIKILTKDRRERPNARMYTAMLHSYVSCSDGTAGKVAKMLSEMEIAGVELDGRGAECVLEALAVHPDYLLRTDILEYMRARWFEVSDRAQNFVVAGMLRERLFEQALEKMDDMIRRRIKIEGWLWDKTIWTLLEYDEVEEAFYVLNLRQNVEGPGVKLTNVLWQALLDAAAKNDLAQGTAMIWNTQVIPGYLKPPTGTCISALSVAARSGDVKLATHVFSLLAERNITLTAHHYEALMESYLRNNDLYAALTVILYMHESVFKVSPEALHPLFTYLSKTPSRPLQAFSILQNLTEAEKKKVPLAALNTCIHASVVQDRLPEAIEFYKALHTVGKAQPNATTFNFLLAGCHRQGRKELAMYLTAEMIERNVAPDRLTYDRLIITCLNAGDLNDAMLYYEEMTTEGFETRRTTHENLVRACLKEGDTRAVALVRDYREREGVDPWQVRALERLVRGRMEMDPVGEGDVEDRAKVGVGA